MTEAHPTRRRPGDRVVDIDPAVARELGVGTVLRCSADTHCSVDWDLDGTNEVHRLAHLRLAEPGETYPPIRDTSGADRG